MTYHSHPLLENLQADVRQIILAAEKLRNLPAATLVQPPAPGRWSVAQTLQHLNFYGHHYLNAIEEGLHLNKTVSKPFFRPGWLGNYFTKLMKPAPDGSLGKKMQSPKAARPQAQPDASAELRTFLDQQHRLLNLLRLSKSADIGELRIPTSLSKMIKLKLGDTFRFVVAHEQRHLVQMDKALATLAQGKKENGKASVQAA